jgi:hypothetical protein
MLSPDWLNTEDRFVPGVELFRSDRAFALWAYTVSHSQLLLRTRTTRADGSRQSRIDILFKPVRAMKIRADYDGLVIRCATSAEAERITTEYSDFRDDARCLVLESGSSRDYVVADAVGWNEDTETDRDPSALAFFPPGTDPDRILE